MFSQLFGKYLVDNKVITKEQLDEVISKMENVRAPFRRHASGG